MPDNNEAKRRPLRSRDEVWLPGQARAKRKGTNISRVINDYVLEYGRAPVTPDGLISIMETLDAFDMSAEEWERWTSLAAKRYAREEARKFDQNGRRIFDAFVTPQEGSRYLLVEVPEIDAVTQAVKIENIEPMARDLIAITLDIDPNSFEVEFPGPVNSHA